MSFDTRPRVARWHERLTLPRAIASILTVAVLLVLIAGALARLVEPEVFTSLGLAYWWAITTVTTVGYGDVVPKDPAGRVVGSLLMLTGLSLIPTLTSVIVSTLISKRTLAQTAHFEEQLALSTATLVRIEERLERIEGGIAAPPERST
jgi:voltage-gated potassium channel Kch